MPTPPLEMIPREHREILLRQLASSRFLMNVSLVNPERPPIETYMGRPLSEISDAELNQYISDLTPNPSEDRDIQLSGDFDIQIDDVNPVNRDLRIIDYAHHEVHEGLPASRATDAGPFNATMATDGSWIQTDSHIDINPHRARDLFYQEYMNQPIAPVPYGPPWPHIIDLTESPTRRRMMIPWRSSVEEFDRMRKMEEPANELAEIVYSSMWRIVRIKDVDSNPGRGDIGRYGVHRLGSVFHLKGEIQFDRDFRDYTVNFIQEVPMCEVSPQGKFGIDIERLPHCDNCKSWEDCCDFKGILEEQETLCKEANYPYIVDIVQQALTKS